MTNRERIAMYRAMLQIAHAAAIKSAALEDWAEAAMWLRNVFTLKQRLLQAEGRV